MVEKGCTFTRVQEYHLTADNNNCESSGKLHCSDSSYFSDSSDSSDSSYCSDSNERRYIEVGANTSSLVSPTENLAFLNNILFWLMDPDKFKNKAHI